MSAKTRKVDVLDVIQEMRHALSDGEVLLRIQGLDGCAMSSKAAKRQSAAYVAAKNIGEVLSEVITKADRFGVLFEAWNRDDESVPADLKGTTESAVIDAMYEMRTALSRTGGAV